MGTFDRNALNSENGNTDNTYQTFANTSNIGATAKIKFSILRSSHPQACNFIKNETLVQVFSCEFCETLKNIFSYKLLRWLLLDSPELT